MSTSHPWFVKYVHDFYGPDGVHPMGASFEQITRATEILVERHGASVMYDSVDRERVRDILIEQFGLVFPEGTA